jgi:hypothetical protein
MAKRVSVDRWMFTVTLLLVFVGLVMVFSASAVMAKERYGSPYSFLLKQAIWAIAGIAFMLVGMKIDYRKLKHPAVVFSLLGSTTLMLISVFFLDRAHNTHRWIHWGGFSFQPSELAKPALILFLAYFLENRTKAMDDWRNTLLPAVIPTLLFLGLIVFHSCAVRADLSRELSPRSHSCVSQSLCRSTGAWLSHYSVSYRSEHRRNNGPRPDGREAEVVLSSRATHRLHLRRNGRRVRTCWERVACRTIRGFLVAWPENGGEDGRCLWALSRGRDHQHGGTASLHQHECGSGPHADQGNPAAVRIVRGLLSIRDSVMRRRSPEHHPADRLISLARIGLPDPE